MKIFPAPVIAFVILLHAFSLLSVPRAAADLVALWHFGKVDDGFVPEKTGSGMDLLIHGEAELVEGLDGKAMWFPGEEFYATTDNHPPLRMTNQVTVDVWIKPDEATQQGLNCVIEKGGNRYRVMVSSGGTAYFGVKNQDERGDLSTDFSMLPDEWTRITGVFERPILQLYVDGDLVEEGIWDHDMDAGGDLFVGAVRGRQHFFKGVIDTIAIYNTPRPPQDGDYEALREQYP